MEVGAEFAPIRTLRNDDCDSALEPGIPMNDSPFSEYGIPDDNPYAPPPSSSKPDHATVGPGGEVLLPPGLVRGLVGHVQVVGILMIVQGVLTAVYGLIMGIMGTVLPQFMQAAMQTDPNMQEAPFTPKQFGGLMMAVYLGMGIVMLILGILYIVGGMRVMQFRSRVFGIIAQGLGLGTVFGCYCLPTAVALIVYGLIVFLNQPVKIAFDLRQQGATADQIRRAFAKLPK